MQFAYPLKKCVHLIKMRIAKRTDKSEFVYSRRLVILYYVSKIPSEITANRIIGAIAIIIRAVICLIVFRVWELSYL